MKSSMMINICLLLIVILSNVSSNFILSEYEHCDAPLGMESGSITDNDLTSSSTHDVSSVGPQMARIRSEIEGGAWCPEKPIGINSYEYLQIELRELFFLNSIETQGRFGNGQGREFAEFYQIQYQRENQSSSTSQWITYQNRKTNKTILDGNRNTYLAEKRSLSTPILAKRIRIVPFSTRWRTVCMRVELYGCPFYGGVTSYTNSPSVEKDNSYDGGIGKLTDGIIESADNSHRMIWNKSPVSIEFHFDEIRLFKSIKIYTMNPKYQSIDLKFDDQPLIKHYISPVEISSANIYLDTIQLDKYGNLFRAKTIEMIFEFQQDLILTEITFDNELTSLINTTSILNTTTNCSIVAITNTTTISSSSSLPIIPFEWLTIFIGSIISLILICLFLLSFYCLRQRSHHRLRQNSSLYYKSSQMTATTSGSCVSTSSDHDGKTQSNHYFLSNNYDDMTSEQQSMGSYIYPITSTTSLLQTTPSSSILKCEQYAVIDGNYANNSYKQWPTNNTFHYASSDIGKLDKICSNQQMSLFNCILPQENLLTKTIHQCPTNFPSDVDQKNLIALKKISESKTGEIYFGNYSIDHDKKSVLIKIIKTNSVHLAKEKFLNELEILSRLKHKNISCLYAVQLDLLYLIQEHSSFGTIKDYFHEISNQQINDSNFQKLNIYFAYQLANAIQYLNHLNLLHCDIAARNCLFYSDYTIKLTDCAMALSQYENEYWIINDGRQIPLRWIAPEALTTCPTLKSDIYSYAITLWEIWSRCSSLPYGSLTNEEVYQRIFLRSEYPLNLSVPPDCPKEIYDLLCECWHVDGTKRPNISDIALYFRRHVEVTRLNNN